ncbi:hypothetical protein [Lichenicola sp.]|uniref:hypothetical protein n=1 Tax=Lichenicola sp. TaxID=2804529 RepID=UPI003AFFCED3
MPVTPAHGLTTVSDPVILTDGCHHLRLASGDIVPLFEAPGLPSCSFLPGWSPVALYSGAGAVSVLAFEGPGGATGCWLLDRDNVRLGDSLGELPPELAADLLDSLRPVVAALAGELLLRTHPSPSALQEALAFLHLGRELREQVADALSLDLVVPPQVLLADALATSTLVPTPDGVVPEVAIDRLLVRAGFAVDLQDRLVSSTLAGLLEWPSPVDGRMVATQQCLYLDDFRLAYRFVDSRHGLLFYVVASDHLCRSLALYLPTADLLVVKDDWSRHLTEVYFPVGIARRLAAHCAVWATELVPALSVGARGMASVMRGPGGAHLGHQLWNELTGMENLLTHANGAELPEWIVAGGPEGVEFWGPIERLFPELEGRVNRSLASDADIASHLYANRLCAARVTGERVSAELRRRLQASIDMAPARARLRALQHGDDIASAGADDERPPVILFGLRVENRTLTDLAGFCVRLAGFIAETWPGAVLVLDGHNAREVGSGVHGTRIMSHGEVFAPTEPLVIEQAIAAQVREAVLGRPVHIVDTLGLPIAESLAWSMLSDCFISIWGASLAKFRWVCNKPGLAISSRANLLHRDDLHIYDLPRYMEDPTQLLMADPAAVTDDGAAPRLVPVALDNPFFANFRVDEDRLFDQFRAFVFEVMTAKSIAPEPEDVLAS